MDRKKLLRKIGGLLATAVLAVGLVPMTALAAPTGGENQTEIADLRWESESKDCSIKIYGTKGGGTVTLKDPTSFLPGEKRIYTAKASDDWEFAGWEYVIKVDGSSVKNAKYGESYYVSKAGDEKKGYSHGADEASKVSETIQINRPEKETENASLEYQLYAVFKEKESGMISDRDISAESKSEDGDTVEEAKRDSGDTDTVEEAKRDSENTDTVEETKRDSDDIDTIEEIQQNTTETTAGTGEKSEGSVSVTMENWTYGETAETPKVESSTNDVAAASFLYESTDDQGYKGSTVPTDAGNYKVTVTLPENLQYQSCEASDEFTISPRDIVAAEVTLGTTRIYTGKELTQKVEKVVLDEWNVTYTVSGNQETGVGVYELTVTGTGNFTGTVKKEWRILPDTSAIDKLTLSNVTSANETDIEKVKKSVDTAKTDMADEALKKEWKQISDRCTELLNRIDEAAMARQTENIKDTEKVTDQNVKLSDKKKLQQAKEDLNQAVNNYKGNYTADEKQKISDDLNRIKLALQSIEHVEETRTLINKLPDKSKVAEKDRDAIHAAKASYDNLTTHEKSMLGQESKTKLSDAITALNKLTTSTNKKTTKKTAAKKTPAKKTTVKKTAASVKKNPSTGDETNLTLWISLMMLALIGVVSACFVKRKR